jgi:hypothetical protein
MAGRTIVVAVVVWATCLIDGQPSVRADQPARSPTALQAEIDKLRVRQVAWRQIAWKSCLLEGLRESRKQNKPVLLWVFIDRPTDDARC